MDPSMTEDGPCTVCAAPGRACAGCFSVHYCGREHQVKHWQSGHKEACAPYKISKDPVLGRYLEATQDIEAGTFIMKSKPLVYGPQMSSEPVCLSCCRRLDHDPEEWYQCTVCGWPLCSTKCQESEQHRPECGAMAKSGFYMGRDCSKVTILGGLEEINQWSWYGSIVPIRSLLLPQKDFKKMMTLQSHLEEHQRNPEFNFKVRSVTSFIHNTLKLRDFKAEDVATVLAIFDTNAFEVSRDELNQTGRALYYMGSMMAHDCKPNARLCYVGEKFEMALMAEQHIPQGSSINISYMDRLNGTLKRLTHLRTTKYFDCCCARCHDPTDLGLYLDSLRCTKCKGEGKSSLLVSTNPTKLTANWQCQEPTCGHIVSAAEMIKLHKEIKTAKMNIDNKMELFYYKNFIEMHTGPEGLLHSTSTYILQIKIFLIFNVLGHTPGYYLKELKGDLLEYKICLIKEMMDVAKVLHPGYSKTRAFLLMELQEALTEELRRSIKNKRISSQKVQEASDEIRTILQEAASILREPARRVIVHEKLQKFNDYCKHLGLKVM